MESSLLPISQCETQERSASTSQLIKEWLFRFGVEHKEDVAPKLPLWLEAFGGMDAQTLESLFRKTLKTCKFFPKVSEILAPLETAKQAALPEEASEAWQRVLAIRREHYNPDLPQYLSAALALLSERTQRAARAAGVFREFDSVDDLHTWAKKRFIESYLAWDEIEENQFLLPDGELKGIFADVAATKALPPAESYKAMRERGLAYAAQLKSSPAETGQPYPPRFRGCAQPARSIEEQKRILRERGLLP